LNLEAGLVGDSSAAVYNDPEKTGNVLVGLASILGNDNVTTTQIYTQKPPRALRNEIDKVQF
jgi:hypothetical protein